METGISVSLPVIRKAIFTLAIDGVTELFNVIDYSFTETINRADEFNGVTDEVDVFAKEMAIDKFKKDIVFFFVQMMLYSDYGMCQDLRGMFDYLEMLIEQELLVDGVEEVDINSEDFELSTECSPLLHFLYYFTNTTSHEEHIRITQIFQDIKIVDEYGIDLDLDTLQIELSAEQINLLCATAE